MKKTLKIKISNFATWIMIGTIGLIILWFVGYIVSLTFDLNVFTSSTSEFFFSIIGFAFVLVSCAAILSISLNISLIADSKLEEIKAADSNSVFNKKFFYIVGLLIVLLISFLFVGDFLSRQNKKNKLENEAADLISRYGKSIDELTIYIQDTAQIHKIPEFLKILSNQKEEFPSIYLITSDEYEGETVFLEIDNWTSVKSLKEPYFGNSFYKCNMNDCEYLQNVFENGDSKSYFWTKSDNYRYYFPVEKNGKKIILLFTKTDRYGKFGS